METVFEAEDDSREIMPEKRSGTFRGFKSLNNSRIKYQTGVMEGRPTIGLVDLLISPRRVEFTDPRDMIFGYMGVADLPISGGPHTISTCLVIGRYTTSTRKP
jgi:hypothetical protein